MKSQTQAYPMVEVEELLVEELVDIEESELIVFNDDFNTFEHVTKILIKVCQHTTEQAEQCTLIIHYKGKCAVKKGSREKLKPMCQAILDAGIQAAVL
jgi:ATP-dependent Clp protease adaptor protein ClpS